MGSLLRHLFVTLIPLYSDIFETMSTIMDNTILEPPDLEPKEVDPDIPVTEEEEAMILKEEAMEDELELQRVRKIHTLSHKCSLWMGMIHKKKFQNHVLQI